jgi:hypothetical protein
LCVIVDASVAGLVFADPHRADYQPLWDWLERKGGVLVYGGRLAANGELKGKKTLLAELKRAGRAYECPKANVDREEKAVKEMGLCRSNDPHVIALARESGARILCANDGNLEADFKNQQLVPNPRGSIYKNAGHKRLLKHNKICIGRPT